MSCRARAALPSRGMPSERLLRLQHNNVWDSIWELMRFSQPRSNEGSLAMACFVDDPIIGVAGTEVFRRRLLTTHHVTLGSLRLQAGMGKSLPRYGIKRNCRTRSTYRSPSQHNALHTRLGRRRTKTNAGGRHRRTSRSSQVESLYSFGIHVPLESLVESPTPSSHYSGRGRGDAL